MNNPNYIAIEGVIGAGKTSLATKIAERLNAKLILEKFEENPYLEKFYEQPDKYAFRTQIYFLLERYTHLVGLLQEDLFQSHIVSDYIFEKDKIFAYLNLNDSELKLYETLAFTLDKNIIIPDLVVYLQSSVERLMANIRMRNRDIENQMSESYIEELNEAYNYFFSRYKNSKVMIVNCDEVDFVNSDEDFEDLFHEICKEDHPATEYYNPTLRKKAQ